jgi:hypothetical protein
VDIRQNARIISTRPIVFAMAVLAVLALALMVWHPLASGSRSQSHGTQSTYATGGPFDTRVHGTDPYSPHDPLVGPPTGTSSADPYSPHDSMVGPATGASNADPYSPRDPLVAGQ